jgi:hypothetical protein
MLRYCAKEELENTLELDCIADTQLEAQAPPGPVDAVVQSATGADLGIVKLPNFPEISKSI